jgi:hypothetical protein
VSEPVMVAVAVALVTKAAEGLSEGGKAAFTALARLVRRKLRADPVSLSALESTQTQPDDKTRIQRLAEALERAVSKDQAFAEELTRLWNGLSDQQAVAGDGGVTNQVSGPVSGNVVQARDVHGGISFGPRTPPKAGSIDDA